MKNIVFFMGSWDKPIGQAINGNIAILIIDNTNFTKKIDSILKNLTVPTKRPYFSLMAQAATHRLIDSIHNTAIVCLIVIIHCQ